jgi:hypothetical protein
MMGDPGSAHTAIIGDPNLVPHTVVPPHTVPPAFTANSSAPNVWTQSDSGAATSPPIGAAIAPKPRSGTIRARASLMIAFSALASVMLVTLAIAVASRVKARRSPTASEPAATVRVVLPGPTSSEDAQIEFTIKVAPPEARIFVDGKALPANPAGGKRPRDGAIHVLRAEAAGYEPREESITFERSLLITMELHPSISVPTVEIANSGSSRQRNGRRPTHTHTKTPDAETPSQP